MPATPYSPMGRPQKHVSQDRMQEILRKNTSKSTSPAELKHLDHEMWLAKRLGQHGQHVFAGDTDPQKRKERFRNAIKEAGFEVVIVGRGKNGEPETYASCFARLFGEPL